MVRGEGLRRYLAVNAAALLGLHDRVVDPLGKGGRVSDTSLENVLAREKELLLRLAKLIVELAGGLEVACRGCEVGGVTVFVVGMPGRLGKSNHKNISIRGEGEHSGTTHDCQFPLTNQAPDFLNASTADWSSPRA